MSLSGLNIVQKGTDRKTSKMVPEQWWLGEDPFLLGVGLFSEEQR